LLAFAQLAVALVGEESEKPMTAFSGVRNSWLMVDRKRILEFAGALGFLLGAYQGFFPTRWRLRISLVTITLYTADEKDDHDDQTRMSMKTRDVICS